MICVAIVFTIAFIVIVGGIFGIFWGMHETEENRAIVVSSSGRVKGATTQSIRSLGFVQKCNNVQPVHKSSLITLSFHKTGL